jgi:hypothetical protein
MSEQKKKFRNIYSRELCVRLIHRGFTYEYELPNSERPGFVFWVFEASEKLQKEIEAYMEDKAKKKNK